MIPACLPREHSPTAASSKLRGHVLEDWESLQVKWYAWLTSVPICCGTQTHSRWAIPPHATQTNTTNQGPSQYFCANFQKGRCLKESPHPGMIKGTEVMTQHICAKCLLHGKKIAYHPETSPQCPLAWPKITQVSYPQVHLNSQLALSQVIKPTHSSMLPNYAGLRIPHPSKFDSKFLDDHLTRHEDRFIVECLKFGCPIGLNRDKFLTKLPVSNHKGAMQHPAAIDKYLETELSQGSCIGPFKRNPFT